MASSTTSRTEVSVVVASSEKAAEKSAANAIELVRGSAGTAKEGSWIHIAVSFPGSAEPLTSSMALAADFSAAFSLLATNHADLCLDVVLDAIFFKTSIPGFPRLLDLRGGALHLASVMPLPLPVHMAKLA